MRALVFGWMTILALFASACAGDDGAGAPRPSAGGSVSGDVSASALAAAPYRLDPLPGLAAAGRSYANGLNEAGTVVGAASKMADPTSSLHATRWSPGAAPRDLGLLAGGATSAGAGINALGQVTGGAAVSTVASHAFLYRGDPGPMIDIGWLALGGLTPAFQSIAGTGINDAGQVSGTSPLQLGAPSYSAFTRAFVWQSGHMTDLGSLGDTNSSGLAINARGWVTGSTSTPTAAMHAFLWTGTTMTDLDVCPGATTSEGAALTAAGDVAGMCFFPQANGYPSGHRAFRHAFYRAVSGTMIDLGTLGGLKSQAFGVATGGVVVGKSDVPTTVTDARTRAFVWTAAAGMRDLNMLVTAPGWLLTEAHAVNGRGQIAGNGLLDGAPRAFLLTPQ